MAVAQASGEVGTDSVVCIRASGYPKDFAGIASVAKETFHFPFQYQTGERHRHFRLFLHRDSECVFLREVIPVSKAFFLLRGRQEQIEEVSAISDWWMCFALFPNSGMGCLIMFYRKLAARVKRFMQKGFIIRL